MKAHIGAHAESGLVHTVRGTSGNVHDVTQGNSLLHGKETVAFGDAGYQGVDKRPDAKAKVKWHIAMRPGKRRALNMDNAADVQVEQPFHQAPVWLCEGTLPGFEEEHGPTRHTVCAVQSVDGAWQADGDSCS